MTVAPKISDHGAHIPESPATVESSLAMNCSTKRCPTLNVNFEYIPTAEIQDEGTSNGDEVSHSTRTLTVPKAASEYAVPMEIQEERTIIGKYDNISNGTATAKPRNITENTSTSGTQIKSDGSYVLTEAALTAHNEHLSNNLSFEESQTLTRADELLRAAHETGFDLPRECFEAEKWNLSEWAKNERHLRERRYRA
ncbi:hypothetical protein K505DRAFT_357865 [Melanomma pulvis-pyrius CBS 109.77]|uniref:Uncharacterized protein n=1 Tax=Melanomma pulvis-pyrius CBS 109.77 TaxID=1314802 RepID=A0A6A6XNE6_9PLEO|nr:hypothetical protein K505DRAFT_357865 [Melanomma pulvis-pyrius CBS 109.77]